MTYSTHHLESEFDPEFDPEFDLDRDEPKLTPMERWFDRFERAFVVLSIFYLSGTLYTLLVWNFSSADPMMTRTDVVEITSPLGSLMRYFILLSLAVLVCVRWRSVFEMARRRKALWLLIGWVYLSCNWSTNVNSLKLANELFATTLTALYIASRFRIREFLPLAALGFGITAAINFLFCLAFPQFGIQTGLQEGSWRGVLIQKNSLAHLIVMGSMPFLCLVFSGIKEHSKWYWSGLWISVLLVILSTSKTGLLILILGAILVPIFQKMRSRHPFALPLFICALLVATIGSFLLIGNYEAILLGLGRDPSLSGRTDIWEAILEKILERPITGYGYNGFWMAREGESIDIWYRSKDLPPHGHNGYLNMSLDLGLVGLGIFLASLFKAFQRSFRWLRWTSGPEGLLPILFLCEMVVYNITEESLIANANFNVVWLLYVYLTTSILTHPIDPSSSIESFDDDLEPEFN